ncbi:AAA family ATPase [Myxococcota bacterium]
MQRMAPGPFGQTAVSTAVLEGLVEATDLGLAAAAHLEGAILGELSESGSFAVAKLEQEHLRLLAAFQVVVTADSAVRRISERCPVPTVEGALELDGVDQMLSESDRSTLAARIMGLARGYLEVKATQYDREGPADLFAGTTLGAAFELLRRAVEIFSRAGQLRAMVEALAARKVTVAGYPYEGFSLQAPTETPAGLLPVWPEEIVGNDTYLEAGLHLARDVAGYDFVLGKNPKKLNPVLFGLGAPGCGKTVTAHAVGNYFLKFCREREVPARFLVVRRTDWASSFQNASANNLVRIFREEVYGFSGVCGVYWPDIDTAFASRASTDLRMEEKNNLGAVFGVFDGTLLPKDGKWFLICDANTMRMDEATVSRIAQNPFAVSGPTTVEHYVTLMREIILKDVREFVPSDHPAWVRIGAQAIEHGLSGRAIDTICTNIRTRIQDFEYPSHYFKASTNERQEILGKLSNPVDEVFILQAMRDWVAFKDEAHKREEDERFEAEVETVVRQLNAGRAAMERASEMGLGE